MASYAKRVAESDHDVRYELRVSFDAEPTGVVTIPNDAPGEFVVEGERGTRILAEAVMAKLLRARRETGVWPASESHVAG